MQIVLNEKDWILTALEKNDLGQRPMYTLAAYARYLYGMGMAKKEIRTKLEELLLRCDSHINLLRWSDRIDEAIKHAGDRALIELDGVTVTDEEISAIQKADGVLRQRVLFTLLCLAKYYRIAYNRTGYWVNVDIADIFKLANVQVNTTKRGLMLADLIDGGFIAKGRRLDNNGVCVRFVDDGSEPVMMISDFRNLGYQYENYIRGGFTQCAECGAIIRRKSNRQKYCAACARVIKNMKAIEVYEDTVA